MSTIEFSPVTVNRGRKFRGFGYLVKGGYEYSRGYRNSGVDPYQVRYYVKIWDPQNKTFGYASEDYVVDSPVTDEQLEADKKIYVDTIIESTIEWCKSKNSDPIEAKKFARNVLRKNYPELQDEIDAVLPDHRDVVSEIEKTLNWAMDLKTRPCYMYGRHCPGGKPLKDEKKIAIAMKSLIRKGITKLDNFKEMWELQLNIRGLGEYVDFKV